MAELITVKQVKGEDTNGSLTLEQIQESVGGYFEIVGGVFDGRIMLAQEEGLLKGLEKNILASKMAGKIIVGPVLLVNVVGEDMF